jgi:methylated-DNA-[protein]-cysteine S-methyltransferase
MPTHHFDTAFGRCAISWRDAGLTAFALPDAARPAPAGDAAPPDWVRTLAGRVRRHLQGDLQDFSREPYDFSRVAEFPGRVYRITLGVKAGATCSYGDLARALGQPPAASRAIGAALGANPWPLLVPCHRVVAADGRMTGFSGPGGIRTKLRLLALEGAQLFAE